MDHVWWFAKLVGNLNAKSGCKRKSYVHKILMPHIGEPLSNCKNQDAYMLNQSHSLILRPTPPSALS